MNIVKGSKRKQRGVALLIVVFALLLVTGIALAMLGSADVETGINQNYRETQQAYFAAQGGIAEAIDRIKLGQVLPTAMPSGSSNLGVVYIINKNSSSEVVTPWDMSSSSPYPDTEFCKENFGISGVTNNGTGAPCATIPSGNNWYTTVTSNSPFNQTSAALDYKWVRVTLKGDSSSYPYFTNGTAATGAQVCGDGYGAEVLLSSSYTSCTTPGYFPVYVVTSLAVTNRGTRRMVQREVTKIKIPPLPGALTLDGPAPPSGTGGYIPPYDAPSSNGFVIDGTDASSAAGCGLTPTPKPAIGTVDTVTKTDVVAGIPSNRYDHYIGSGGASPDVQVLSSTALAGWNTPGGAEAVANMLRDAALSSNVYTGNQSGINIGSPSNPQITYVNGDLTMTGNPSGGGILVVTGTLNMSGNTSFDGIILVIGKGSFVANGGGNGQYTGAMLIAKTRDSSGNLLSTLGEPVVDWSGGGGNGIVYSSCKINNVQNSIGFRTQATRELLY